MEDDGKDTGYSSIYISRDYDAQFKNTGTYSYLLYSKNGFGPEKSHTFYLPFMLTQKNNNTIMNGTYTGFFRPESGKLSYMEKTTFVS